MFFKSLLTLKDLDQYLSQMTQNKQADLFIGKRDLKMQLRKKRRKKDDLSFK